MAKAKWPSGYAGLNSFYGNPTGADGRLSQAWRDQNIVAMPLVYPMRLAWEPATTITRISMHRLVVPTLTKILSTIWNDARVMVKEKVGYDKATDYYDAQTMALLRSDGLDLYGGGFNYRRKRGGSTLSVHSYGAAIDIDPARNGMGDTTPAMPLWVVGIFEAEGAVWGGRWSGRNCDGMHMQFARNV